MKVYQAAGFSEQGIKQSLTFCTVRAFYYWWIGPQWESRLYLSGALQYLDMYTREY